MRLWENYDTVIEGFREKHAMKGEADYRRALELARRGRRRHAERVITLLLHAISEGHSMAAHALATWYYFGIGVRKDLARAFALEKIAARHGIGEAIHNVASSYEKGKGVKKDLRRAYLAYRKAWACGDASSAYEVGRCLYYGIGTKQRRALAWKWLDRSRSSNADSSGAAVARKTRATVPKKRPSVDPPEG
jgi:TPR repeat protein